MQTEQQRSQVRNSLQIGQGVEISWPGGPDVIAGWVRRVGRTRLHLGVDHPQVATLAPDDVVSVRYSAPDVGSCQLKARVQHVETTWRTVGPLVVRSPSRLILSNPDKLEVSQRRSFVRMPVRLPIELEVDGRWIPGQGRCLSAGGMRAELPEEVTEGQEIRLRFALPSGIVSAQGVILRCDPVQRRGGSDGRRHEIAVAFLASRQLQDVVVRYVLEQQRQAVARRRQDEEALEGQRL